MESYYDREEGVAWGPVTREEILDDIFLRNKNVAKHRHTLTSLPTFDNKQLRVLEKTHDEKNSKPNTKEKNETSVIEISSDEEYITDKIKIRPPTPLKSYASQESLSEIDIKQERIDQNVVYSSLENRLPTPANLDESTYDDDFYDDATDNLRDDTKEEVSLDNEYGNPKNTNISLVEDDSIEEIVNLVTSEDETKTSQKSLDKLLEDDLVEEIENFVTSDDKKEFLQKGVRSFLKGDLEDEIENLDSSENEEEISRRGLKGFIKYLEKEIANSETSEDEEEISRKGPKSFIDDDLVEVENLVSSEEEKEILQKGDSVDEIEILDSSENEEETSQKVLKKDITEHKKETSRKSLKYLNEDDLTENLDTEAEEIANPETSEDEEEISPKDPKSFIDDDLAEAENLVSSEEEKEILQKGDSVDEIEILDSSENEEETSQKVLKKDITEHKQETSRKSLKYLNEDDLTENLDTEAEEIANLENSEDEEEISPKDPKSFIDDDLAEVENLVSSEEEKEILQKCDSVDEIEILDSCENEEETSQKVLKKDTTEDEKDSSRKGLKSFSEADLAKETENLDTEAEEIENLHSVDKRDSPQKGIKSFIAEDLAGEPENLDTSNNEDENETSQNGRFAFNSINDKINTSSNLSNKEQREDKNNHTFNYILEDMEILNVSNDKMENLNVTEDIADISPKDLNKENSKIHVPKETENLNKETKKSLNDNKEYQEDILNYSLEKTTNSNVIEDKQSVVSQDLSEEYHKDSDVFNDTLEEMEKFLSEGLNHSMETDKSKVDTNLLVPEIVVKTTPMDQIFKEKTPQRNTPCIKLPNSAPKLNQNKGAIKKLPRSESKIPTIPISTQRSNLNKPLFKSTTPKTKEFLTPNTAVTRSRFKNIESPISIYIKNSGKTPLYQNVNPKKTLSCEKIKTHRSEVNKENSIVIPEVIYKPAKSSIVIKEPGIKLPKKIDSLIPQRSHIIKHTGRIGAGNTSISRKLLEDDISVNSNTSLNTTGDISMLYKKNAFIT